MGSPLPRPLVEVGYRLIDVHPVLEWLIGATYGTGMEAYVRLRTWWNYRASDSTVDPFGVIHVDPAAITTQITDPDRPLYACVVRGGDWDLTKPEPLADYYGYRGFVQHFEEGLAWEETDLYAEAHERIVERDWEIWSYRDIDAFRDHLDDVDDLYTDMAEHGYRSQRELAADGGLESVGGLPVGIDEVRVAIGRDGEIIFLDGRHRLFCAKLLDIEAIPVRVTLRHETWQRRRERGVPDGDGSQPDVQPVE